jgi:serine/threonine-protein kinase
LLAPGTALGRYELIAPIAQGGMAQVWAARLKGSRGFQKLVAIKTILPHLSDDARFERMFLDEAGLASRIRHPHVVEILDLGEEGDVLYLVMEWIDGETLATVLRKTAAPVPLAIASRLMIQACAGLHAAHELQGDDGQLVHLVHRDVSPQNLLVTRQGSLKVVDFGIAKALNRIAGETAVGSIKGKVPYMAPEQAIGADVDRRTDVFALGTVYYFLVTGRHPFRTDDEHATLQNVIAAEPPPPREIDPGFPVEIEEVILKALARDRRDRFETMAAFETAIAEAMSKLRLTANDQSVKEYLAATLGGRGEQARERLAAAIRDVDRRAAATEGSPGRARGASTPVTPRSDAATTVTAPTKDDTAVSVGSDVVTEKLVRPRRRGRIAALGALTLAGAIGVAAWLRLGPSTEPRQAPLFATVSSSSGAEPKPEPSLAATPAPAPTTDAPDEAANAATTTTASAPQSNATSIKSTRPRNGSRPLSPARSPSSTPSAIATAPPPPPAPTTTHSSGLLPLDVK